LKWESGIVHLPFEKLEDILFLSDMYQGGEDSRKATKFIWSTTTANSVDTVVDIVRLGFGRLKSQTLFNPSSGEDLDQQSVGKDFEDAAAGVRIQFLCCRSQKDAQRSPGVSGVPIRTLLLGDNLCNALS
jgi:hypothetical protein